MNVLNPPAWALSLGFLISWGASAQGVLMSLNHDSQGLGLAATYLNSEFYTMVGENGTTTDGYASGVADLDCFGERFFYVLANPYRLVTLDAVTGELLGNVTIENTLDADVPASNIAYDWTDDKLYGVAHSYNAGTDIQLICIAPETGTVEAVGDDPDDDASFGSGNCEIDALGNRYFLFAGGKLKVWDTGTGEQTVNVSLPTLFGSSSLESWTHPMYHPVEDRIYAIHMLQPESYDFNGPPFQTELRLARLHPETAEAEWFTPNAISMDGIQSGVCDLDPFNNRIFYQRVDGMKVFSTDGTALSTISSPSNSISPWANVQYHDLSTPPTAVVGEDSDGQTVEWDGTSSLTLAHGLGNAVSFDGWSGVSGETSMDLHGAVLEVRTRVVDPTVPRAPLPEPGGDAPRPHLVATVHDPPAEGGEAHAQHRRGVEVAGFDDDALRQAPTRFVHHREEDHLHYVVLRHRGKRPL